MGLVLHDIGAGGRVLLSEDSQRTRLVARAPAGAEERDLTWLDGSGAVALSADARVVFFNESWDGGGATYSAYMRHTDGAPAVRLGDGIINSLTPDGRFAIMTTQRAPRQVLRVPIAAGDAATLTDGTMSHLKARVGPDGRLFFIGHEPGAPPAVYVRGGPEGGPPTLLSDMAIHNPIHFVLSADGKLIALQGADRRPWLLSTAGGAATPLPGSLAGEVPYELTPDGRSLYVADRLQLPVRVIVVDVATGARRPHLTIPVRDPAGVAGMTAVVLSPDGQSYAYHHLQWLSALFIADGLR